MPVREFNAWFFHGTSALPAACIVVDGFRLLSESLRNFGPGYIGGGIYVTASLETAARFSSEVGYVLRVRLTPGTRILRLNGQFDQKVIDSLRREFGAGVLCSEFDRALPQNKKLRRVELINLFNYLWEGELFGMFSDDHRQVRRHLAKSQYHGMGDTESSIGVVIFNPSRLILDSVLRWSPSQQGLTAADPVELLDQAACVFCNQIQWTLNRQLFLSQTECLPADWVREEIEKLNALRRELPRWQRCLQRFAERHHLPTNNSNFRRAMETIPLPIQ